MGAILIRHTPVDVPKGVCYGRTDVDLAPGWEAHFSETETQLRAVCARHEIEPNSLQIVHSPLNRCARLAVFLHEQLGAELLVKDQRLSEFHFGTWEMQRWDDFYQTPDGLRWFKNPLEVAAPGGEAYPELRERVLEAWRAWESSSHPLCLVSHAGPLRVLLSHLHGIPAEQSLSEPFHHGEARWVG